MKKRFYAPLIAIALGFTACPNQTTPVDNCEHEKEPMIIIVNTPNKPTQNQNQVQDGDGFRDRNEYGKEGSLDSKTN